MGFSVNDAQLALTAFNTSLRGELSVVQYDRSLLDNTSLGFIVTNAKFDNIIPIPINTFKLHEDDGALHFSRNGSLTCRVSRGVQTGGALINLYKAAEYDGAAEIWPATPDVIAATIGNGEILDLAHLLNGAYSGFPADEFGNVIAVQDDPNVPRRLSSVLQVYAQIEDARPHIVISGDTANYFPINPMYPTNTALGDPWFNGYEDSELTPANVRRALVNLQLRRNFMGQLLGYGTNPATVELWHAPELGPIAKDVLGELVILPGTGPLGQTAVQVAITGDTKSQVVYGSQTNTMVGKAKPRQLVGLRPDLWGLVEVGAQKTKEHALFWAARGGSGSSYQINTDPGASTNSAVPYVAIQQHNPVPESPVFMGAIPGTMAGDFGFGVRVNKGMYLVSPHRGVWNFTGSAS
jgi:hypothetical protein